MTEQTNKEVGEYLHRFTKREDALMARVTTLGLELPDRLSQWRLWIGDPVIYLSELRYWVEQQERAHR